MVWLMNLEIIQGDLVSAVAVADKITEFDGLYSLIVYQKRLEGVQNLVLTAFDGDRAAGFKIGYDRFNNGSFYSWMGGVLPQYRSQGVANALADYQENWAKKQGYKFIHLKTRKKHQNMVTFSLGRGFVIGEIIQKIPTEETRIWMEKIL